MRCQGWFHTTVATVDASLMYSANDRHLGIFQYGRKASNAGNNAQLAQLQARIAELERENRDLKKQLSNSKSDMNAYKQQAERAKMDANELKHQLNAREYQAPPPMTRTAKKDTQTEVQSEAEIALQDRLSHMAGKQREHAIKILRKIAMAWLGKSTRGRLFTWECKWRESKEEQAKLDAMSADELAAYELEKVCSHCFRPPRPLCGHCYFAACVG